MSYHYSVDICSVIVDGMPPTPPPGAFSRLFRRFSRIFEFELAGLLTVKFWSGSTRISYKKGRYNYGQCLSSAQWKMIIHFHYPKNEVFSPAVFNILKEPFIVQKETLHQQKALDLSYLDLEGQGRGIVRRAPHPHFVKSKFRFFQ